MVVFLFVNSIVEGVCVFNYKIYKGKIYIL